MEHASGRRDRHAAVICEFNPFHNGHVRLLSTMRSAVGTDGCVICLMSGRFVQRGTPAVADPYTRARMALAGGADLVLELPFPWSAAGAESFATAGVSVLYRLGVDRLAFGSETGDEALLNAAAGVVASPDFPVRCVALCHTGVGTAAAYTTALRELLTARPDVGEIPQNFPSSNDILAIHYLTAVRRQGGYTDAPLRPLILRREGQAYRDDLLHDPSAPSASALRLLIREAAEDRCALTALLEGTAPLAALDLLFSAVDDGTAPTREDAILPYCHGLFRLGDASSLAGYAELSGGLAERMIKAAKETGTPEEFLQACHSKLYTDARLRRAMLFAAAGVTPEDLKAAPTYTTVLAANAIGRRFLKEQRKGGALPLVTKAADAPKGRQRELSEMADALFTLCLPTPRESGWLCRISPDIV